MIVVFSSYAHTLAMRMLHVTVNAGIEGVHDRSHFLACKEN